MARLYMMGFVYTDSCAGYHVMLSWRVVLSLISVEPHRAMHAEIDTPLKFILEFRKNYIPGHLNIIMRNNSVLFLYYSSVDLLMRKSG